MYGKIIIINFIKRTSLSLTIVKFSAKKTSRNELTNLFFIIFIDFGRKTGT
jgi:hypothetical protein